MGNEKFAERIKTLREGKNLTQDALAKKFGIAKTRVCMWETNGTIPRQDVFLELCKFFGVSADYLLGNDVSYDNPNNEIIASVQRGFSRLNPTEQETAKNILKAAFENAFKEV